MLFGKDGYNYKDMLRDLIDVSALFDVDLYSIGKSVLGQDLWCVKLGCGSVNIFLNGAHHALEWITSPLLVRFIYDILTYAKGEKRLVSFDVRELLSKTTIHILPMVNPDGVDVVNNPDFSSSPYYEKIKKLNKEEDFTKNWQSNINGVDLNHNYNANFHYGKNFEIKNGIYGPCNTRYSGLFPESEPEVKAVCDYVRKNNFGLVMAFHSQGKVIYYDYNGHTPQNGYEIAKELGAVSGYRPERTTGFASFGGFKDWFIEKFDKPAFTIEVGMGKNPLGIYQFEEIYNDILPLIITGSFLA